MKTKIIIILLFLSFNGFTQYSPTTIKTPKGTNVTAGIFIGTDWTTQEKNDEKNYWLNYYDNRIIYRGEATKKYNCHAYAWHVIEGGNKVWINSPEDDEYWNDLSYTEVYTQSNNLKVSYGGPCVYYSSEFDETADWCDHSAITTSQTNYFISKWGKSCLFEHYKDDCPYDTQDLHFYKFSKPTISGNFSAICDGSQRTFSEFTFTDIDLEYDWSGAGYYLDEVSGDGTPSYTVEGTSNIGYATISLTVTTPSGAISSNHDYVGVNTPYPGNLSLSLYTSGGTPVSYMCPDTHYHIYLNNNDGCSLSNYDWSIPAGWTENYTWSNMISVYSGSTPGGMVEVDATTCCGVTTTVLTDYLMSGYCGSMYSMILSPNPTTGETTLSIETVSEDTEFDENAGWELEVFDQAQMPKAKNTKLKGNTYTINTSGWKEGIYFVRVKYKDEVLVGKLVVK